MENHNLLYARINIKISALLLGTLQTNAPVTKGSDP
jgi:hypothetical protein